MNQIQGKIIRILDNKNVIINLGSNDYVDHQTVFSILARPEPIIDPFSNELLGEVPIVKAKVKAIQIYNRFTIASSHWSYTDLKLSEISGSLTRLLEFGSEEVTVDNELNIIENDVQSWKARLDEPIRIGDIVIASIDGPENDYAKDQVQKEETIDGTNSEKAFEETSDDVKS